MSSLIPCITLTLHVRSFAATIIQTVFGIDIADGEDDCFRMAQVLTRIGVEMSTPGTFLVDVFPILRFVPSWFPGGDFKRIAREWKAISHQYRDLLYLRGIECMVSFQTLCISI